MSNKIRLKIAFEIRDELGLACSAQGDLLADIKESSITHHAQIEVIDPEVNEEDEIKGVGLTTTLAVLDYLQKRFDAK